MYFSPNFYYLVLLLLLIYIVRWYSWLQYQTLPLITHLLNVRDLKSPLLRLFRLRMLELCFFLRDYYILNDLIWQDGFLIDFLQKKIVDKWTRKFLIYSSYLFNERWLFDYVVRFYIDLVIWPGYRINIYEFNNIASTLMITLFLAINLFLLISLLYFWITLF